MHILTCMSLAFSLFIHFESVQFLAATDQQISMNIFTLRNAAVPQIKMLMKNLMVAAAFRTFLQL